MNSGLPEMLSSGKKITMSVSVLERECSQLHPDRLMQQEFLTCFNQNQQFGCEFLDNGDQGIGEVVAGRAMKADPDMEYRWGDSFLDHGNGSSFAMGFTIPRTVSCPKAAMLEVETTNKAEFGYNSRKRKADETQKPDVASDEKKRCAEDDLKITDQKSISKSTITTTTIDDNKDYNMNGKGASKSDLQVSEAPKPDYVHVRARRGQATDSHSLAERVRREKISERMKYLQNLVPGCNKITGKAGMLDEIINYVQSLQRQVEFLSMKLAAINPVLDSGINNYLVTEIVPACTNIIPIIETSSQMVSSNLPFSTLTQGVPGPNPEIGVTPSDVTLRRTISAPASDPDIYLESSFLNHLPWEDELQNLYFVEHQQGRSTSFMSQPYTGPQKSGNVKVEM